MAIIKKNTTIISLYRGKCCLTVNSIVCTPPKENAAGRNARPRLQNCRRRICPGGNRWRATGWGLESWNVSIETLALNETPSKSPASIYTSCCSNSPEILSLHHKISNLGTIYNLQAQGLPNIPFDPFRTSNLGTQYQPWEQYVYILTSGYYRTQLQKSTKMCTQVHNVYNCGCRQEAEFVHYDRLRKLKLRVQCAVTNHQDRPAPNKCADHLSPEKMVARFKGCQVMRSFLWKCNGRLTLERDPGVFGCRLWEKDSVD